MMRLLEPDDLDFLRGQPGFTWRMATRLQAQRCQLFRGYLRSLDQDFQQVAMALKLILLHSSQDRPDLTAAFDPAGGLLCGAHRRGPSAAGTVPLDLCRADAAGVVKILDSMRLQLQGLVPATADLIA